jgi:hypothetical protein
MQIAKRMERSSMEQKHPVTRIRVNIEIPAEGTRRLVWLIIEIVGLASLIAWAIREIPRSW